jgi:hypothetical protein
MGLLKGLVNDAEHRLGLINTAASYSEGSLFDCWNGSLLSWQEHFVLLSNSRVAWNSHAHFCPHSFQLTIRIMFLPQCYLTYAVEKWSLNTKKQTNFSSHALLALKHIQFSVNYFAFAYEVATGELLLGTGCFFCNCGMFIWTIAFCWLFPIHISKFFFHLLLY